ncbi:MAG: 6-pyruvoyl-tetrahydropterin synthase-related protein [Chloroflexota bacterium]|nr:6-pyruvoyl-tetrahydropterin synthase-related protein [Chloroflexota bacterium]
MADAALHVYRTVELVRLWQDGIFYSRWAPDLAFGLGYPLYNFYTPLFYYLSGAFSVVGLNFELATKATLALILLVGSAGMYGLAREWVGKQGALLATVAFAFAPFRLRELYFQGDFAQYLALSLPPVIMWSLHRLVVTGKRRYFAISAFTYAALFLSHSISTMLFTPLIVVYAALILLRWPARRQRAPIVVLALGIGLGLSAFFWVPALYEQQFVNLDALRTGDFDYRQHFPPALELFSPSVPLDTSAVNPYQPFTLGIMQLLVALPSLRLLTSGRKKGAAVAASLASSSEESGANVRLLAGAAWLALLACIFMMLPISSPIWEAVPPLRFTEFPWRWLGAAALPLALLTGTAALTMGRWRGTYVSLAAVAIMIAVFPLLYPREPFTRYDRATIVDLLQNELQTQAIGTTSAGEFLPREVKRRPTSSPLVPAYLQGLPLDKLDRLSLPSASAASLLEHRALSDRWRIVMTEPSSVRIYTLFYRGWSAFVDGEEVPIVASVPEGYITVRVPSGEHELAVRFGDTPERRMATAVSAVTALLMALILLLWRPGLGDTERAGAGQSPERGSEQRQRSPGCLVPGISQARSAPVRRGSTGTSTVALAVGGMCLVLLLAKVAYIDPYTTWFRAASDLAHIPGLDHPLQAAFGGQVQLLGYTTDRGTARPGEGVRVTLFWRSVQPLDRTYSAFLHLIGQPGLIAQKDNVHPGGVPSTSWRSNQYVRDEHRIVVPEQALPGIYRFRVGIYEPVSGERLPLEDATQLDILLPSVLRIGSSPPQQASAAECRFGDDIRLVAYYVPVQVVNPGDPLVFRLYWQSSRPVENSYTVFAHLYDSQGKRWGGGDGLPLDGDYPTNDWPVGEVIEEVRTIQVDQSSPEGLYYLAVGLYSLETMQRLPARDSQGTRLPDDALRLAAPIEVRR